MDLVFSDLDRIYRPADFYFLNGSQHLFQYSKTELINEHSGKSELKGINNNNVELQQHFGCSPNRGRSLP